MQIDAGNVDSLVGDNYDLRGFARSFNTVVSS